MTDIKFVDGLRAYKPHERAPDFVKGALTINKPELMKWLSEQREEQIRVDLKESRNGNWYLSVNDYKPQGSDRGSASGSPPPADMANQYNESHAAHVGGDEFDDDIPF